MRQLASGNVEDVSIRYQEVPSSKEVEGGWHIPSGWHDSQATDSIGLRFREMAARGDVYQGIYRNLDLYLTQVEWPDEEKGIFFTEKDGELGALWDKHTIFAHGLDCMEYPVDPQRINTMDNALGALASILDTMNDTLFQEQPDGTLVFDGELYKKSYIELCSNYARVTLNLRNLTSAENSFTKRVRQWINGALAKLAPTPQASTLTDKTAGLVSAATQMPHSPSTQAPQQSALF